MIFSPAKLAGAWLIDIERRGDERGFFARTMCRDEFAAHGLSSEFVQQNLSVSARAGTLRGMHFQRQPFAEAKLVRCARGSIFDVILDLRPGSSTYMQHESFELSAHRRAMLYIPEGFAHGFQTLEDDAEVNYLVTAPYTPEAEDGVRYDDPTFAITWPLPVSTIAPKDTAWPLVGAGERPNI